jgi:pectate lyase
MPGTGFAANSLHAKTAGAPQIAARNDTVRLAVPSKRPPLAADAAREIVFIEGNVTDVQSLAHGVRPGISVVVLDPRADGLTQMLAALDGRQNLTAIHVVSHGAEATLALGTLLLTPTTLTTRAPELATLGRSLASGGDLLLYGCEIGAGTGGRAFVSALSQAIRAEVTASSDITGRSGNWVLEVQSGPMHRDVAFLPAAIDAYAYDLPAWTTEDFGPAQGQNLNLRSKTLGRLTYSADDGIVGLNNASGASGFAGEAFYYNYTRQATNWIQFQSTTLSDTFKITSMNIDTRSLSSTADSTFKIEGFKNGSVVVSVSSIDFTALNTYGSGNSAVVLSDATSSGGGGLLSFGSAWNDIDTVRFTSLVGSGVIAEIDNLALIDPIVPPAITSATVPADKTYAAGQVMDFTVTYDEAMTVDTSGGTPYIGLTLDTGGTVHAAYLSGSGSSTLTFRYTVATGNLDSDGVAIAAAITLNGGTIKNGASSDGAVTGISFPSTINVRVDAVVPSASSINRTGSATTAATSVDYTVTFSESVSGVDSSDFTLTPTSTAAGTVASVNQVNGSTYTVTVNSLSGDGTLRLDLSSGTGITDTAGNAIATGYTSGQMYTLDHTAPAVTHVTVPANATYVSGQSLNFTVFFDGMVSVNTTGGAPRLALTVGAVTRYATLTTTGASQLVFTYVVQAGDFDADGVTVGALELNGGTIKDAAGNDATLTLNSVASTASVLVDAIAPIVSSITRTGSATTSATSVSYTVTFSESVTGVDSTDFTVTATGSAAGTVASGTPVNGTTYTVAINSISGNGTLRLDLKSSGTGISDAAGNAISGGFTAGDTYTIDTVAPTAPSVTSITTDTGASATDGITSDTTLSITGTAEANGTVTVFINTASIGTTTADSNGAWTFDHTGTILTSGNYAITATATDGASNVSPISTAFNVTVDTVAPAAPVIAAISDDTGTNNTDQITSDTTLMLSGTAEANATVTVSRNAAQIGTATADGTGVWTFDYTGTTLAAGTHTFTAMATDLAGNTSAVSADLLVEIDIATPAAPVITGISNDTGASATDGITSDNTLVFAGTAGAGDTVTLSRNGVGVIGTTIANGTGVWSFDYSATTLPDGGYLFTAFASDVAGNHSTVSADFPVTIDTTAPAITTQPVGGTYTVGDSFTISVSATDSSALAYQWYLGATALADSSNRTGATTASVTHTTIGVVGFSGNYTVGVTDLAGNTTTSTGAAVIVNKAEQTITFPAIPDQLATTAPFALSATASTGFAVTFSVVSGPAAISGNTVTLTGAGLVTIRASQTGDVNYAAAPDVDRSFIVVGDYSAPTPDGFANLATGGAGTGLLSVTVTTAADFRTQAESSTPSIITVIGLLNLGPAPVNVKSNKTIQGADAGATLVGNLTFASGVNNVVIRGLTLTNPGTTIAGDAYTDGGDAITVAGARNVFITHCSFFNAADHALKITNGADNVTVSWSEFYYTAAQTVHRYSVLIGTATGETAPIHVSLHHNKWGAGVDQHMPAVTFGYVHLYNNVFNAPGNTTGVEALDQSQLLSERNVYLGVVNPLTRRQVSAALAIGRILALGDMYSATTGTLPYSGADAVFTPSYAYEALPVSDVAAVVNAHAGNTAGASYADVATGSATITGPASSVTSGSTLTLTVTATGFVPTSYQWRRNNLDLPGATSSSYNAANAQATNAGIYTVALGLASEDEVVSSPFNVTVSDPVVVTPPVTPPSSDGGGGAISSGLVGALALLTLIRLRRKDSASNAI